VETVLGHKSSSGTETPSSKLLTQSGQRGAIHVGREHQLGADHQLSSGLILDITPKVEGGQVKAEGLLTIRELASDGTGDSQGLLQFKTSEVLFNLQAADGKTMEFLLADGSKAELTFHLVPSAPASEPQRLTYPYAPYNEGKMDPQLTGWPLSGEQMAWVLKGEYTRKPGHEVDTHLPDMWFVTPTASRWGKDPAINDWITHHGTLIDQVRAAGPTIDIALLGDSITQGWGGGWDGLPFTTAWKRSFDERKVVNLGIGGDRIENILWRLDHGALDGASPKVIVLMIGVNNAPLVFANRVPAMRAAQGIKLCLDNLRLRCSNSQIILLKVLPAFDPTKETGKAVLEINKAIDQEGLDADPHVHILELTGDFTHPDGTLKTELYSGDNLHLGPAGYEVLAEKLKPLVDQLLDESRSAKAPSASTPDATPSTGV